MPPCTTRRRITTNLKTKNIQNCQKIELYGSLTTKELKKKHSSRPVGGAVQEAQEVRTRSKAVGDGLGQARWWLLDPNIPHFRADKLGGATGE